MRVTIKTSIAGHADPKAGLERDFAFHPGQEVELDDELAAKWIAAGIAAAPEAAPTRGAKKSKG